MTTTQTKAIVPKHVTAPMDSAEALIAQGIEKGISVDTMERLLAMRRELRAERAKEAYDRAMAGFQSKCPTIVKTKAVKTKSGAIAYRYAPIESIIDQVKHLLQKYGFSYTTGMELMQGGVKVTCRVTHTRGHTEESSMEVPFGNKTDIMSQSQVAAAATTFAKRYAFCNAFGIMTGDEDTDAKDTDGDPLAPARPHNSDKAFETAKTAIQNATNDGWLIKQQENIEMSTLYTRPQKKELSALISARIDELNNQ